MAVSLRNCSAQEQRVPDLLPPEYGLLRISLGLPGGATRPHRPAVRREARGRRERSLAPGEAVSTWVSFYADARGWLLDRAGGYELRAEYAFEKTRLAARPLSLAVTAPATESERSAARLTMDAAATRLLLTGQDDAGRGEAQLLRLLNEHPQSRLAPYARLALGLARSQRRFDAERKAFAPADCAGAARLLAPAVESAGDPFLAARGARALADCLRALGRPAEAERVVAGYGAARPDALKLPGVAEVLRDAGTGSRRP